MLKGFHILYNVVRFTLVAIILSDQPPISRNPDWKLGETQSPVTGYAGLLAILLSAAFVVWAGECTDLSKLAVWDLRKIIGMVFIFLVMALTDSLIFKSYRRNFDFSKAKEIDMDARGRIFRRQVSLILCFVLIWPVFLVTNFWFPQFLIFFYFLAPLILLGSPFYFYLLEKHGVYDTDDDELLILADWLFRRQGMDERRREHLFNLFRGILVKGFFIPFMVVSCITFWNYWELHAGEALSHSIFSGENTALAWSSFFKATMDLIILVDVTIASLGYLTSCRILDTQFTSVEPTILGWIVAVACYPPFNIYFESCAWKYASFELTPDIYVNYPVLSAVMAVAIVVLMSIYCWSTVVFGLRFSNLTNRGIITSGPYALVRHPAYASKNLSWWLALIGFMVATGKLMFLAIVVLVVINVTYYLRAVTEESHLLREDHYKEYCKRVKWRLFPGLH